LYDFSSNDYTSVVVKTELTRRTGVRRAAGHVYEG
jgi:hypothetical protein